MPDSTLYERLLSDNVALLDVRAPIEFHKGAFPGAHNIPLLNDTERAAVGTRYKQAGQDAAIALGNQLVCGSIRDARVQAWTQWLQTRPGPGSTVFAAACAHRPCRDGCRRQAWSVPAYPGVTRPCGSS